MRSITINDAQIKRQNLTQSSGILATCLRRPVCNPNPCMNNGQCIDNWFTASCQCSQNRTGPSCDQGIIAAATYLLLSAITIAHCQ